MQRVKEGLQSGISALVARRFGQVCSRHGSRNESKAGNLEFVGAVTDITKRKTTEEDSGAVRGTWRKRRR